MTAKYGTVEEDGGRPTLRIVPPPVHPAPVRERPMTPAEERMARHLIRQAIKRLREARR